MKKIIVILSLLLYIDIVFCRFIGSPFVNLNNSRPVNKCGSIKCKSNSDCEEGYKCIYCYHDDTRFMSIGYNLCTKIN